MALRNELTLEIANEQLTFRIENPHIFRNISREYSLLRTSHSNYTQIISVKQKRTTNNIRGLRILSKRDTIDIVRDDFESHSDRAFKKTSLEILFNKYSFNSWLRIYFTLIGLAKKILLIHAASYFHNGHAFIFIGKSGQGKSRLMRLLGINKVLSDEISIIYEKDGEYFSSTTPFWGELKAPRRKIKCTRVKALYFIGKGPTLKCVKLSKNDSFKRLLSNSLFFSKDLSLISKLLHFCSAISNEMPCYKLDISFQNKKAEILGVLK